MGWLNRLAHRCWAPLRTKRRQMDRLLQIRREAGLTTELMTRHEAYIMALDAFDIAIRGEDVERLLRLLVLPLTASEVEDVAVAMATLGRPNYLDTHKHADIVRMKLQLAWIWTPEMDR